MYISFSFNSTSNRSSHTTVVEAVKNHFLCVKWIFMKWILVCERFWIYIQYKKARNRKMDDLHSFHTRSYDKSDDVEEISPWQQAISLIAALPLMVAKLLIVGLALIFEFLQQIFFSIVPRPLNDISGQLAVVSVHCFHGFVCYEKKCECALLKRVSFFIIKL